MRYRVLFVVWVLLIVALPLPSEAGDGLVALQTADPSCGDDSGNIYVDCGNGTVTDNRTGLVWLKKTDCVDVIVEWSAAMGVAARLADMSPVSVFVPQFGCGLSDGSSPGAWRLPSGAEWETMIADGLDCNPTITNDSGEGCWLDGPSSFLGVQSANYWSATASGARSAWVVNLLSGNVFAGGTDSNLRVWPVRVVP